LLDAIKKKQIPSTQLIIFTYLDMINFKEVVD